MRARCGATGQDSQGRPPGLNLIMGALWLSARSFPGTHGVCKEKHDVNTDIAVNGKKTNLLHLAPALQVIGAHRIVIYVAWRHFNFSFLLELFWIFLSR